MVVLVQPSVHPCGLCQTGVLFAGAAAAGAVTWPSLCSSCQTGVLLEAVRAVEACLRWQLGASTVLAPTCAAPSCSACAAPPPPGCPRRRRQGAVEAGQGGQEGRGRSAHPRPQAQAPVQRQAAPRHHRPAVACLAARLPTRPGWLAGWPCRECCCCCLMWCLLALPSPACWSAPRQTSNLHFLRSSVCPALSPSLALCRAPLPLYHFL